MRSLPTRGAAAALAAALAAVLLTGCTDGGSGYTISGRFPQAVALFERSPVLLMGVRVGDVASVEVEGDRVRVEMVIDEGVPLPEGLTAAISPVSLIGERNVLLGPAWKPGDVAIGDGYEIPDDDIGRVVEPDEVLLAIRDLVEAVDPDRLEQFLGDTAATIDGQGEAFNRALEDGAALLDLAASRDDDLLATARRLRDLAEVLNSREDRLEDLFAAYARVSAVLADERETARQLLDDLDALVDEGEQFVLTVEDQLPSTLGDLVQISLHLEGNVDGINQFVAALADTGDAVVEAYDEETESLSFRLEASTSLVALLLDLLSDETGIELDCPPLLPICPPAP